MQRERRVAQGVAGPPARSAPPAASARSYVLPGLLLVAGSFLLMMALLYPLVVAPAARSIPLDRYTVVTSQGQGSYTSIRTGELATTDQLRRTVTVRGDVDAGSDDVAVWEVFDALEDVAPGVPQPDRVVAEVRELVALDRRTGESVACCGEDPPHEGLTLRFPLDAGPGPHDLWDAELRAARPASLARTDRIGGLDVGVFVHRVEPTPVGAEGSGGLAGTIVYAADREVWVEPDTGLVVRVDESLRWTLEGPGAPSQPYRTADLTWAPDSVEAAVAEAAALRADLRRLTIYYPVGGLLAGGALLAGGIRMTARIRSGAPVPADYGRRARAS